MIPRPLARSRSAAGSRLLAALSALAAVAALSAAPALAGPRPLNTGISYVDGNDALTMQQLRATGSTLAQTPVRWAVVAPEQQPTSWNPADPADPNYDWSFTDAWVKNAVAAGLTPVFQIRSAPRWADRCTPSATAYDAICKPDPAALAAFTTAAVRRYSGSFGGLPRVAYWQALNEPNLSLFFQPQFEGGKLVSPTIYRNLLNTFYAAVKAVDPSDQVIAGGLGPIAVPGFTVGPMKFTRQLLCMSGGKKPKPTPGNCEGGVHFDIFDIHPYTSGSPSHEGGPNDVEMGDLGKLQNLLHAADRAGRIANTAKGRTPLWITEFSYDSKPPDPGGLAMKIESQWIPEALHQAWRNGVSNFFWYSLVDSEPQPQRPFSETLESGLYFWSPTVAGQRPKPAMRAYRFPFLAIREGDGLEYWGRTPDYLGGKIVLEAQHGKRWRRLGVARANSVGIFRGKVKTGYGETKKGAVRARFGGDASPGFPMRRAGDFPQPPFG
ncbi:MAG: hypothetical protein ACOYD4_09835 [Solirubrobacterales bacterium]